MSANYSYYVGVISENNETRYVTDLDPENLVWGCENKAPLNMKKTVAEELADAMVAKGYTAFVVKSQLPIPGNPGVKADAENEKTLCFSRYATVASDFDVIKIFTLNGERFVKFIGFRYISSHVFEADKDDKTVCGFLEFVHNIVPMKEFVSKSLAHWDSLNFNASRNNGEPFYVRRLTSNGYKSFYEKYGDGKEPPLLRKSDATNAPDGYYRCIVKEDE